MGARIRVLHLLNQFFGGLGGEESAQLAARIVPGARGPGRLLERLDPEVHVVATLVFGDDWAAQNLERAAAEAIARLDEASPAIGPVDLILAGPAFLAGRYGMACAALCKAIGAHLGRPAAVAMHPDNPGAEAYRRDVLIVRAGRDVMDMKGALERLVLVGRRCCRGDTPDPSVDPVLPRGLRRNTLRASAGAERALDMLLHKLRGEPFVSEYPLPVFDRVPPAPALSDLENATVAIVTSGGIVPRGNPDQIESADASKFGRYPLAGLETLSAESHQSVHGGYDITSANEDPNRVLPLDVLRVLEREGRIGRLYGHYYATVGNGTSVERARGFGASIAAQLVNDGVQAVLLTST